ncbi:MAG: hypothetical protein IPM97_04600 [Bdellovibrionaceae bacterium]|nr:hypothetical protein [Pseudobdellovibrionaceae bacterium]
MALGNPFVEPIGEFLGTADEWDSVLLVSSIGSMGCSLTKFFLNKAYKHNAPENLLLAPAATLEYSTWYLKYRNATLILSTLLVSALGVFNLKYGITVSGVVAATILPWPLNAFTGWLLYIGFAILISHISYLEFAFFKTTARSFSLSVYEGLVSSVSIISRGLFLFHVIPVVIVNLVNRDKLLMSWRMTSWFIAQFIVAFLVGSAGVTLIRNYLFDDGSSIFDFYQFEDKDILLFELSDLSQSLPMQKQTKTKAHTVDSEPLCQRQPQTQQQTASRLP